VSILIKELKGILSTTHIPTEHVIGVKLTCVGGLMEDRCTSNKHSR